MFREGATFVSQVRVPARAVSKPFSGLQAVPHSLLLQSEDEDGLGAPSFIFGLGPAPNPESLG